MASAPAELWPTELWFIWPTCYSYRWYLQPDNACYWRLPTAATAVWFFLWPAGLRSVIIIWNIDAVMPVTSSITCTNKVFSSLCHYFAAGYPAAQSSTQGYSQSTQGYGASGYDTTPSAATPAASQSYGGQSAYTAQTAYPGYAQQAAPTAPQAYVSTGLSCIHFSSGAFSLLEFLVKWSTAS
ncbi:unnamed protein product [Tetraodon nigroviridis]|uniref:(spotted green pufferfish) hypothetical protein n=1 Tax=Tetraodon nigroviridis TaxID=99883 RepID=Q4RT00_TETNG|nr:unnamed protein product [Tetraodon nigroviridis]